MPANREYKDSVFSLYLSDPKRLIEIFNAIEGTDYPPDTPVEINTLDDALYKERINDLSFILNNQVLVLVEHQSTVNYNMAIRLLMYVGRLYEKLVKNEVIYRAKPVEIPMPKFVVLYNGKEDLPEYSVQRLSDSYKRINGEKQEKVSLELNVEIYNINYDKSPHLLQQSKSLNEYSMFVYQVKEALKYCDGLDTAVAEAIKYCVGNNIMKEFLEANGSEVCNMLFTEWDWDKYIEISKEEAYEDGYDDGKVEERKDLIRKFSKKLSPEDIAETLQVTKEYVIDVLQGEMCVGERPAVCGVKKQESYE